MDTAVVFDSAGTLLQTYRIAKEIAYGRLVNDIESTTLTCAVKGRGLVLLYTHSQDIMDTDGDILLSKYLRAKKVSYGLACSSGVVSKDDIETALYHDTKAKVSDLQECIKCVWAGCRDNPLVAMNSGVIINKNTKCIEYSITASGYPFKNSKETIKRLHDMGVAVYVASGDRTDKLLKMADYLGIPHENVHGVSTPNIKAQIVKDLKSKYHNVAMVGDGVNDLAAMREADIAIFTTQQSCKKPKILSETADYTINDVMEVVSIIEKSR